MPQRPLGTDVFNEALDRMIAVYQAGHRVVVSFSAGKDSNICLELAILAATATNRLPVEVVMQDEEIALPGTYEYAERTAARPEVDFHWVYSCQPMVNVANRAQPYWWVFDPLLDPEDWVRQPPSFARRIPNLNLFSMVTPEHFPPPKGKDLMVVIGLRVQESSNRRAGLHSSGGYLTKPTKEGFIKCRPIYDWTDGDVWKAIRDYGWDYNRAYDTMHRMGVPRHRLRIAPPTMNHHGIKDLEIGRQAWPRWFDRVCRRLPGVRSAVQFGLRAVTPQRRLGETWEQCYQRTCIDEAPEWIAERAVKLRADRLAKHGRHATTDYPQATACSLCDKGLNNWKKLCFAIYGGDPYSTRVGNILPWVEPEFFRPGAGTWEGSPGGW